VTPLALVVHPAAEAEFEAIRTWYGAVNLSAALRFVEQLQGAFNAVCAHPRRCALWRGKLGRLGVRRYVMRRFPYVLPYIVQEEAVFVLAIAHTKRRPDYWRNRLPLGSL
jgi:toxin ParE1/3/4